MLDKVIIIYILQSDFHNNQVYVNIGDFSLKDITEVAFNDLSKAFFSLLFYYYYFRYAVPNFDPNTQESISFDIESRFFSMKMFRD